MNIKRLLLTLITIVCLSSIFIALTQSFGEPQVQARLQLYQSNLMLHATELKNEGNNDELVELSQTLLGANPYSTVESQYQDALEITQKSIQTLEENNNKPQVTEVSDLDTPRQQLKTQLKKNQDFIDELNLKLGILEAKQDKTELAFEKWNSLTNNKNGIILTNLWQEDPNILPNSVTEINENLDGWFRYAVLKRIYTLENNQDALLNLESKEQILAQKAIFKLITLSIIPFLGSIVGLGLIIFLLIQRFLKKEESILATNDGIRWETPWDWETVWQVLIVGFLFISQIVLPLLFGIVGFNPVNFSIQGKAIYVLITYLLMSGSGLLVLYLSIKSFFPLPENWFKFRGNRWFLWGIGGYLTAIPFVFIVSFLNDQLWHGQGGSNPLLFLALEAQDKVALAIFFITASVAAPIFEEIIFRGFLLPSLTRYFPVWSAILISAFIFALAHLSLAEVLPLATLGVILGFVYTKSRSLLASILVHSLWNSGTLFSLFVLGSSLD